MTDPYRVILRRRGKTEKHARPTLDQALDLLEDELRVAATQARQHGRDEKGFGKSYTPAEQVVVRGELRGPGRLRAGIDVRGDGDTEAYTGRVVRQVLEQRPREDAYAALRRHVLSEG